MSLQLEEQLVTTGTRSLLIPQPPMLRRRPRDPIAAAEVAPAARR